MTEAIPSGRGEAEPRTVSGAREGGVPLYTMARVNGTYCLVKLPHEHDQLSTPVVAEYDHRTAVLRAEIRNAELLERVRAYLACDPDIRAAQLLGEITAAIGGNS